MQPIEIEIAISQRDMLCDSQSSFPVHVRDLQSRDTGIIRQDYPEHLYASLRYDLNASFVAKDNRILPRGRKDEARSWL